MQEAEHRYRLLFEHGLAGVYCTTVDGVILDCNESLVRMLGYASRDELLSRGADDLYLKTADRREFLDRLRQTGVLTNSELCLRRKDGSPIHFLENVVLVSDAEGQRTVIQGTMVDITDRKATEQELQESERRARELAVDLRRLMQRLQSVREEERSRIARELHDELGQALTALNLDLHWLQGQWGQKSPAAMERISSMRSMVDKTIQAVRQICADLRPTVLDDFGLTAAIEWQAREFEARKGVGCVLSLPPESVELPESQATAVFRIFQESLTNVARHAEATRVEVALRSTKGVLNLVIADNGTGVGQEDLPVLKGLGLAGMRERALLWNGTVDIAAAEGGGTIVRVSMPIGTVDAGGPS